MILGMTTQTFTILHVVISFIAILSGFLVAIGFLNGKRLDGLAGLFLVTTILTSVTGFFFPNSHITPGIIIGIISLAVLTIAVVAQYARALAGAWRSTFVVTAMLALYFNVFVLVVQSFQKVPGLKSLAPTQSEPPFAIAQGIVLLGFIVLTIFAVKRFRVADLGSGVPKSRAASA